VRKFTNDTNIMLERVDSYALKFLKKLPKKLQRNKKFRVKKMGRKKLIRVLKQLRGLKNMSSSRKRVHFLALRKRFTNKKTKVLLYYNVFEKNWALTVKKNKKVSRLSIFLLKKNF